MIRSTNLFWILLVAAFGFGTFMMKYQVQSLDEELARVNRSIREDEDSLHVLKAEWSRLSQPGRLDELARRYLELGPIMTAQLAHVEALPKKEALSDPQDGDRQTSAAPDRTGLALPVPKPGTPHLPRLAHPPVAHPMIAHSGAAPAPAANSGTSNPPVPHPAARPSVPPMKLAAVKAPAAKTRSE
jgi:cell division protein FtsL